MTLNSEHIRHTTQVPTSLLKRQYWKMYTEDCDLYLQQRVIIALEVFQSNNLWHVGATWNQTRRKNNSKLFETLSSTYEMESRKQSLSKVLCLTSSGIHNSVNGNTHTCWGISQFLVLNFITEKFTSYWLRTAYHLKTLFWKRKL